ncbi:hypothetical protein [Vibrio porteresiae]|uniref:Uncharacterized protein n=1 Tax=Vibrio porteresiae DSM 19223 TaxID=1123496 RepID=A0ABZ0QF58_9VIBR|nr:hypothetical protein [Vibrio porteresiae]WPC75098.1 hypothetical protein R8Z52_07840 [Vibrio porteresiae DSM 19223]
MIAVQRDYTLEDKEHNHAHIEVKVCGTIEVDITETHTHLTTDLDHVAFEKVGNKIKVIGVEEDDETHETKEWQLILSAEDAKQLHHDVDDVAEDYENLMNDL